MDDLRAIRVFLAVAANRSFAEAGRQLGLTPASVSRAVAALEARLTTQLLVRTTRQVSLTAAGAVYAARVAPLVEGLAAAAAAARDPDGGTSGLIRLNAPLSLGMRVMPKVLTAFRDMHPGVQISLTLSDEFIDIVDTDHDLAVRISAPPRDKSTIWRKICPVDRWLVTHPGTPQSRAATPEDLPLQLCFAYSPEGRTETWDLTREQARRSVRAGDRVSVNNGEVLARMVMDAPGVALLPRFIVEPAVTDGALARILPDWQPPPIWLTLYYPPYDKLPPRVARFSDFFEAHVTETDPLSSR